MSIEKFSVLLIKSNFLAISRHEDDVKRMNAKEEVEEEDDTKKVKISLDPNMTYRENNKMTQTKIMRNTDQTGLVDDNRCDN